MKTILITGCSSGFGLEIAKHFLAHDWNVVATMRKLQPDVLPKSEHLKIMPLDVRRPESIAAAIKAAGPIDAVVNNAGIGLLSAAETTPMEKIRELFETNTFGTIAVTQSVLPQFRERRSGVVVNVTSTVTTRALPLLSYYSASKAAVNAFTESLALEMKPFNVRVYGVLPGRSPETRFGDNARSRMTEFPEAYASFAKNVMEHMMRADGPVTNAKDVAKEVWRVVNTPSDQVLSPAGADAVEWFKAW